MALKFGDKREVGGEGTSVKMMDGVFVDAGKVLAARVEYNSAKLPTWKYKDDVGLRIVLDVPGKDFNREIYIGGNYKKAVKADGTAVVTGFGTAFKVFRVFTELGITGAINDQGILEEGAAASLVGQTLWYLVYVNRRQPNGKPGYETFELLAARGDTETEDEVRERLLALFKGNNWAFGKRYMPEALEDPSDDFPFSLDNDPSGADTSLF